MIIPNLSKLKSIIFIIIFIISSIQIVTYEQSIAEVEYENLNQIYITNQDFIQGTFNNTLLTPKGEIELALKTNYIKDDFLNESKINYKKNVFIDTSLGRTKLIRIVNTFGGIDRDDGCSIQQTNDNGFIICGHKNVLRSLYSDYESDMWLIKTDSMGNKEWERTFGEYGGDFALSLKQTLDNGYIIVGVTEFYGAGKGDVWLVKTDSKGNEVWNKTFGGPEVDSGNFIQKTSDDGFIITGFTYSYGNGGPDFWLIKTDKYGNELWNRTYGGNDTDYGFFVQQTSDGGYIVIGSTWSYGSGREDLWLIKTDSSGNEKWNKTYGGYHDDGGSCVQQTSDDCYILTGGTRSYDNSDLDLWLLKIDNSGNELWNKTHGGPELDWGGSVQETSDGGFIVGGETRSYNPGGAWIIKTDSSGNEQWNKTYLKYFKSCNSIFQTEDRGYVLTGMFWAWDDKNLSDTYLIKTDEFGNINFKNGELISKNLLQDKNSYSIDTFRYCSSISEGTDIKIQFSQDNINWYNSKGQLNVFDTLTNGINSLQLSSLSWKSSNFYYKLNFTSRDDCKYIPDTPSMQWINISYKIYNNYGTFESSPIEINGDITLMNLVLNGFDPPGTEIYFQLRTAKRESDLFNKSYIGPNGISDTFYKSNGTKIWSGHNNDKWIQIKIYLITTNTSNSPRLKYVSISYNYYPVLTTPKVTPTKGDITYNYNFTVEYIDKDNNKPKYIAVCINGINYTLRESDKTDIIYSDGKSYWYLTKLHMGNYNYQFFTSDGIVNCSTHIKYLSVNQGPLSQIIINPSSLIISLYDYQLFSATGFDDDNNKLNIIFNWSVNGGGVIDQTGNFTPIKPGIWTVYANASNISGNTSITIKNDKENMNIDSDRDGIYDFWELQYDFNIKDPLDAVIDFDGDNLTNLEEFQYQTDPTNPDSDGDGYKDGIEINYNTDPLNSDEFPIEEKEKDNNLKQQESTINIIIGGIIMFIIIIFIIFILFKKKKINFKK
jgi:hypothetical protein